MLRNYPKIGAQVDKLSDALLKSGVVNTVQTVNARKYAVIWIPWSEVKLKLSYNYHLDTAEQLFYEVMGHSARLTDDLSKTLLIPVENIDIYFREIVPSLVKYCFLRYEMLQVLGKRSFPM
jgi:hypothetical protein